MAVAQVTVSVYQSRKACNVFAPMEKQTVQLVSVKVSVMFLLLCFL